MRTLERLSRLLGDVPSDAMEIRIRANRRVQYRCLSGERFGETVCAGRLNDILASLTDHSLHAREAEFRQGCFTLEDGCRVGVCGRAAWDGNRVTAMTAIGSICIRICREIRGAADGFYDFLFHHDKPASALIVSAPGMGKTTALREAARRLSEDGYNVCIADERHELAACVNGVPSLDVGPRTDVVDGCPKRIAVMQLLRAASPQVIVTDEIGDRRDAEALSDAVRCGVAVLASAHAGSFEALALRRSLPRGVFDTGILLGDTPGQVKAIRRIQGG